MYMKGKLSMKGNLATAMKFDSVMKVALPDNAARVKAATAKPIKANL
jgi:hypothetical protein